MAIIKQKDKRSGITYAYEATYRWDKEKKQSRSKRRLLGRVEEQTGNILPTDGRCRRDKPITRKTAAENVPHKRESIAPPMITRSYYGATYLLDAIGEKLGLIADLKRCFPDTWDQILSIVYYLIMESNNPLYRFEKWGATHKHPYNADIPSQRSSELFASITEDQKVKFFRLQGKRRIEKEYWAYDTTSISSYSETLKQVQYGKNKEDDRLPQINLALVFGEESKLPFYYRKLAGNIPDVKTVNTLLEELGTFGFSKVKLVMDRGFYSEANIHNLYKEHLKFLIAAKTSLSQIKKTIDSVYDDMRAFTNFYPDLGVYAITIPSEWNYKQERPYKGDVLSEKRRIYIHLYYNIDKGAEDEKSLDAQLSNLREELQSGKRVDAHEEPYQKFFTVTHTPKRGVRVFPKEEAIREARRYYGYFALLSNEKMDAVTALKLYRTKDVVEKAFGNLKERLNMRRMLVSSEQSLDGKLFVEFVALIYLSYINKQMQQHGLYKDYTMQQVLDKLDVIECFQNPGCDLRVGEVLQKQIELFKLLGVSPISSS